MENVHQLRESASKAKALGIHVFAGGFTIGVKQVMDVDTHLEVHNLGYRTVTERLGLNVIRADAKDWPSPKKFSDCLLCYGNPRCTAFSSVTGGCDRSSHGVYAKQTRDAVELCSYAAGNFDFVVWESVQQAYTVGKGLLDDLYNEFFKPKHYRLCHLFINAASFGNSQNRRRYFFVAYRDNYKFNVQPPPMLKYKPALWDALEPFMNEQTSVQEGFNGDMDHNTSSYLYDEELACVEHLPNGWNLNTFAKHMYDKLPRKFKFTYDHRSSDLPFSLHCMLRLKMTAFSPTLFSGSRRYVHPCYNRGLTAAEFGSIMGWPKGLIPAGSDVVPQLAKGIVPDVGKWIAEQVMLSANGHWGSDDWESSYDWRDNNWAGESTTNRDQKTINLTEYFPHQQDWSRFPDHILRPAYPVPDHVEVYGALDNRILR